MDLEVSEVSLLPSVTRVTGGASEERPPSAWSRLLQEAAACDDPVRFQALARQAQRLEREVGAPHGRAAAKIALLGAASTDMVERPLRLALYLAGLAPTLHVAPYNVWLQEMLERDSGTARFAPQVAIALLTPPIIPVWPEAGANYGVGWSGMSASRVSSSAREAAWAKRSRPSNCISRR